MPRRGTGPSRASAMSTPRRWPASSCRFRITTCRSCKNKTKSQLNTSHCKLPVDSQTRSLCRKSRLWAFWLAVMQVGICLICFSPIVFPGPILGDEPKPLLFTLHSAGGEDVVGSMEKLIDEWSVSLGGASSRSFPGRDVVSLRRQNMLLPPMPRAEQVILANGDRIPGKVLKITEEQAQFQSQLDETREMILPLTALSVFWSSAPEGVDDADLLRRRLATESRRSDMLWLRNGDRIEGSLLGLDEKEARIRAATGKEIKLQRQKLAIVAFNTELARAPRARGPYGRLVLTDGCRISVAAAHTDGNALAGKTLWGTAVRLPLERLIALSIHRGRAVYLSDLKPRRYEHTPYLDL